MIPPLKWVVSRLSQRPDTEHAQALVRLGLLSVVLVFLLWSDFVGSRPPAYGPVMAMVAIGFAVGVALLCAILIRPGRSDLRRIVGMLSDYGLMGAAMAVMGGPLAWVYVLIQWVTVGNGLRYGNRYLYAAMILALLSFGSAATLNVYWHHNLSLTIGLLVGLVAVPLYLAKLLRDLTLATREAMRANEAKSRFLANMSHEFRTPLNGLAGVSELLATTRLDAEQREYLATIRASTSNLLALVEDVLDISAIEAGKVKLVDSVFSVRELVRSIDLILQPAAREKRLDYRSEVADDVPEWVNGDAAHLRQILLNLVSNAVKFTHEGSVRLSVEAVGGEGSLVRLKFLVADTGIGIPESARERLFEAFEQVDTTLARGFGGTGLGTSIAKRLAEAMGGSIGFESRERFGSRFWVELPFAAAAAVPGAAPAGRSGAEGAATGENVIAFGDAFLRHRARVRSMRVLIADDHAANRMVLERLLQKAGHVVSSVAGGEEVLEAVALRDYDAIVVDLHMPGVSGLDLLNEFRVLQAGAPKTPVIVLSADVTPESIRNCERAGAYAFLAKPVVATKLLDLLAEIAAAGARGTAAKQGSGFDPPVAEGDGPESGAFDESVLEELAGLDMGERFLEKFVGQCLEDADASLDRLERAAREEDWDAVRDHAHALKGVASNLGLSALAAASGDVMKTAGWQLRREWPRRLEALRGHLAGGRGLLVARGHASAARDS